MKIFVVIITCLYFSSSLFSQFVVHCPENKTVFPNSQFDSVLTDYPTFENEIDEVIIELESYYDGLLYDCGGRHIQRNWSVVHLEDTTFCDQGISSKHIPLDEIICPTSIEVKDIFSIDILDINNSPRPQITHNGALKDLYDFGSLTMEKYVSSKEIIDSTIGFYIDWSIVDWCGGDSDHGPNHPSRGCSYIISQKWNGEFRFDIYIQNIKNLDLKNLPTIEIEAGDATYEICPPIDSLATMSICMYNLDLSQEISISAYSSENKLKDVSIFDLLLIQRHILRLKKLKSTNRKFAADINGDRKINVRDLVLLRKILLGKIPNFPENKSYVFRKNRIEQSNPFILKDEFFTYKLSVADLLNQKVIFLGIKSGEVN